MYRPTFNPDVYQEDEHGVTMRDAISTDVINIEHKCKYYKCWLFESKRGVITRVDSNPYDIFNTILRITDNLVHHPEYVKIYLYDRKNKILINLTYIHTEDNCKDEYGCIDGALVSVHLSNEIMRYVLPTFGNCLEEIDRTDISKQIKKIFYRR